MFRPFARAAAMRRAVTAAMGATALLVGTVLVGTVSAPASASGVVFAPATVTFGANNSSSFGANNSSSFGANNSSSFGANSGNWAGWVAAAHHTAVAASWRQPSVSCGAHETSDSAFWIGLDGYGSASVEQVGTQSGCANGSAYYSAWTEFYPAPSSVMSTTVRPGDLLHASVTFLSGHSYRLVLTDQTRHWTRTVTGSAARSANASVEVVTEAPTSAQTGKIMSLSHFNATRFTGVSVDHTPLNRLAHRQQLVMGSRSRVMANTSAIASDQSFGVSWRAAAG